MSSLSDFLHIDTPPQPPSCRLTIVLPQEEKPEYKPLFVCEICSRSYRSRKLINKHCLMTEHDLFLGSYVNEEYIKNKRANCKEKKIWFISEACHCVNSIDIICDIRNCNKCEDRRKYKINKRYEEHLKNFKRISLLTLTLKGHHPLDKKVLRDFDYAIKKFLQMLKWRRNYRISYIRVFEIKEKKSGFYYHTHFLIDMPYVPQKRLSEMWHKATGDSFVVDIRNITRWKKEAKVNYVVKYLAKPVTGITDDQYAKFVYATRFSHTLFNTSLNTKGISGRFLLCKEHKNIMSFGSIDKDKEDKGLGNYKDDKEIHSLHKFTTTS